MERWQSGRMHHFRKVAGSQEPREFESPPLRNELTDERLNYSEIPNNSKRERWGGRKEYCNY